MSMFTVWDLHRILFSWAPFPKVETGLFWFSFTVRVRLKRVLRVSLYTKSLNITNLFYSHLSFFIRLGYYYTVIFHLFISTKTVVSFFGIRRRRNQGRKEINWTYGYELLSLEYQSNDSWVSTSFWETEWCSFLVGTRMSCLIHYSNTSIQVGTHKTFITGLWILWISCTE